MIDRRLDLADAPLATGVAEPELEPDTTLTRHQRVALAAPFNLADGHSRQGNGPVHESVLRSIGALYAASEQVEQHSVEQAFAETFFAAAGQQGALALPPPLFHYSASLSIAVAANAVKELGDRIGMVHPTFDNIPALAQRAGLEALPISGSDADVVERLPEDVVALFLVLPNNPNAETLSHESFAYVASECARRDIVLVIDFSFRFFGALDEWDQYETLQRSGARFIGIEDTGKTWPSLDLKVGFAVADPWTQALVRRVTDDYLLNVSPFVLELLRRYVEADDLEAARSIVAANRLVLVRALESAGVGATVEDSPLSVAWVTLPDGWDGDDLARWLSDRGLSVCPGKQFYWADEETGRRFVRVALLRPLPYFAAAAARLSDLLRDYGEARVAGAASEG
jgi:aspartate/methionine/tyrosine aminotransferase